MNITKLTETLKDSIEAYNEFKDLRKHFINTTWAEYGVFTDDGFYVNNKSLVKIYHKVRPISCYINWNEKADYSPNIFPPKKYFVSLEPSDLDEYGFYTTVYENALAFAHMYVLYQLKRTSSQSIKEFYKNEWSSVDKYHVFGLLYPLSTEHFTME